MSARVSRFEAVEPRNVPTLVKNVLRCYTEYDAETLERVWLSWVILAVWAWQGEGGE